MNKLARFLVAFLRHFFGRRCGLTFESSDDAVAAGVLVFSGDKVALPLLGVFCILNFVKFVFVT